MSDQFVHLIVDRLTPEAVYAGVINASGLTDDELNRLRVAWEHFQEVVSTEIEMVITERARRDHNVIPFPKK